MIAPTERSISTRVIPHVMSALVFPKVSAKSPTTSDTVKKSKASHLSMCQPQNKRLFQKVTNVHAKNATRKNSHCCKLSNARVLNGLGIGRSGGLRDEIRVALYRPADLRSRSEYSELGDCSRSSFASC